jgi:hypothetical protein
VARKRKTGSTTRSVAPEEEEFTEEERELVLDYVMVLSAEKIGEMLASHDLPRSGAKIELRERVVTALAEGTLTYRDLVATLDETEPWGKQHVFLYEGPDRELPNWRQPEWVRTHLEGLGLASILNAAVPLILPPELRLSCIHYSAERLRAVAVRRRDYWEHVAEWDQDPEIRDGEEVEYRAFVHRVKRGLVIFEWDFLSNNAHLQVTQLPTQAKYEAVRDEFKRLVAPWLDLDLFTPVDLKPVVKNLHTLATRDGSEVQPQILRYRTMHGRSVSASSPKAQLSLFGEREIDEAIEMVKQHSHGHLIGVFWVDHGTGKPLSTNRAPHVVVLGTENRVNFMRPSSEETVRYVLGRIRTLSQETP